jgi:hypothetical protein
VPADQLRIGALLAAIVQADGTQVEGLVPVSIFTKVHVDQVAARTHSRSLKNLCPFLSDKRPAHVF